MAELRWQLRMGRRVLGLVHLKDIVKGGMKERLASLRSMGIRSVMITGDNPLTAAAIAAEAGVDDFLAQATPKDKLDYIRKEQADGRLVAMTGDGTNDAPALAQADVGVAMNTGTMAAKEAGNMVDLDSNPTKLIEIVAIGKQLLITRGALTTFSIANDVAKYFAIIPAMFMSMYPALGALNIMGLHSPQSAVLSAVIFNALIIIALVPLALRGVQYKPVSAGQMLSRNLLIYGLGGIIVPFPGIWAIDKLIVALGSGVKENHMLKELGPGFRLMVVFTVLTGFLYPAAITGVSAVVIPEAGQRQSGDGERQSGGFEPDRAVVFERGILSSASVFGRQRIRRQRIVGIEPRPLEREAHQRHDEDGRQGQRNRRLRRYLGSNRSLLSRQWNCV